MLEKYKERFDIKHIILTDNSLKKCGDNYIKLSMMMILLTGNTWYGSYNFRPYSLKTNKLKLDEFLNTKYENNIEIMNTITISNANILKYIKLTNKKSIIRDVEKLLEKNSNYLLKDFIKSFIHNYDKTCKYFNIFYEQLFDDIGLYNFYKNIFGLHL